jgi:hypothetical protein
MHWVAKPENLTELLQQCQDETAKVIGPGAAGRLAHWQECRFDEPKLVHFVQGKLRTEKRENGRKLELAGRLSLERIVVYHRPDLVTEEDIIWAKATLAGL